MPRPEYRKKGIVAISGEVPVATRDLLEDIEYKLDLHRYEALIAVIRYYHEKENIPPRPRRKKP